MSHSFASVGNLRPAVSEVVETRDYFKDIVKLLFKCKKVKGKVIPVHAMKAFNCSKLWLYSFILTLREGEWFSSPCDFFDSTEEASRY
jgi:hypothetical protein